ncbi:aminomethyl-transferring glycine dehydrogenase subunit GcvPA [bacterium]|nr:aminomethyl-transferring glycine dehydrogenase subunit GcvPA [bacterium]
MPFSYLPHTDAERAEMLAAIGVSSMDDLYQGVPDSLRAFSLDAIPPSKSELEVTRLLTDLAGQNQSTNQFSSFLGAGAQRRFSPSAVDWILHRSEFLTAYTPYQPEVSQGTLQVIYEFQTMIAQLTGMDLANASMYDGSTATPEAAFMAMRVTKRNKVVVAGSVHPEYREVLRSYAAGPGVQVVEAPLKDGLIDRAKLEALMTDEVAGLIVQVPSFFGGIEEGRSLADLSHAAGALFIVVADPTTLGVLEAPGAYGADIVVGEAQAFGNAVSFGGPYVGYMACREKLARQLPGRIVGQTVDAKGQRCFTLTLQTREQHIRREKATSNICTNQALNALAATVYMEVMGKEGIYELGYVSLQRAHALASTIKELPGFSLPMAGSFFNEFVVKSPLPVDELLTKLRENGILGGVALGTWYPELKDCYLVSVNELNTPADLDRYVATLKALTASAAVGAR